MLGVLGQVCRSQPLKLLAVDRLHRDAIADVLLGVPEHERDAAAVVDDVVDLVLAVTPALFQDLVALQLQVAPNRLHGPLLRFHLATS